MDKFNNIYNNTSLNSAIEEQVINLLNSKIESVPNVTTNSNSIRKAVWLASILAESKDEQHLKKVQDLATLLFLNNQDNIEVLKAAYVLFSRVGNLAATTHLKKLANNSEQENIFTEDLILTQELTNKRIENSIVLKDKTHLLTDFQKNLYNSINLKKYISISAPTSSGKSFILKKYIETELSKNSKYCVFYIVPSRALINQVSEELRVELPNISIKNAFIEDDTMGEEKLIYVITPERAVKIINSETAMLLPNLIFIDEIQNVENEDGRGNLFEYVFEELSKVPDETKIITAGPFISNSHEIFKELFGKESKVIDTDLSPVLQLRTIVKLDSDFISLTLFINNKVAYELKKIIRIDKIENTFNKNIGDGLSEIIATLSNINESSLVYSPRGDYAENWALKYAEALTIDGALETDLQDLIKFVKTDIHPKYFLINCLEKRIAFHHSSLPEFVRKEIETLFEQGIITTLFCTSTLLEGVNLPADNLFVVKPEKNKTELTDFEFGNLIGRAGRLKNTLFGTIYCVSKENKTEWAEDYYKASYSKVVKTSSSRALPEINNNDLLKSSIEIDLPKVKNIVTSLRNKALRDDGSLEKFLTKHNLKEQKKLSVIKSIKQSIQAVTIPHEIVRKNPTIDPILQDKLFKEVMEDIESWVIHTNSNFNTPYRREKAETIAYKLNSFFWQLDSLIVRLDEIFELTTGIWRNNNISISPSSIAINTVSWIQGKSIGELIASRIKYYSEDERVLPAYKIDANNLVHINKQIKAVIKINLNVITFSLLKYLKLLVDILDNILNENQKETFKLTLALPIQIELGTQEPVIISLISNGIPRTISIKLFEFFKRTEEYKNEVKVLNWLKYQVYIDGLEPIYNKFLIKNNFLKIDRK